MPFPYIFPFKFDEFLRRFVSIENIDDTLEFYGTDDSLMCTNIEDNLSFIMTEDSLAFKDVKDMIAFTEVTI